MVSRYLKFSQTESQLVVTAIPQSVCDVVQLIFVTRFELRYNSQQICQDQWMGVDGYYIRIMVRCTAKREYKFVVSTTMIRPFHNNVQYLDP